MEKTIHTEFADGSLLTAKVKDGVLVECPALKISPPYDRGGGSLSIDQAIEFLNDIQAALEAKAPGAWRGFLGDE